MMINRQFEAETPILVGDGIPETGILPRKRKEEYLPAIGLQRALVQKMAVKIMGCFLHGIPDFRLSR